MNKKRVGYLIAAVGVLGIVLSLSADVVGLGKGGIQATQLLGIEIGIVLCSVGVALIIAEQSGKLHVSEINKKVFEFISDTPVIYWVLAGFLFTYLILFTYPVFLNPEQRFAHFDNYLPEGDRIGMDIRAIHSLVQDWVLSRQYHYVDGGVWYPPFYNIFFAPLVLLDSRQAYFIITIVTILCYLFLVLAVPKLVTPSKSNSLILLFFVTGIISYGFQFELERGQYNVVVFLFCMLAIYIFHFHHEFRVFAYLLLTLAVQLKIYPVIFSVLFVKDWRDWRNNIRRMIGLGALNFAVLFILGYSVFVDFIGAIMSRSLGGSIRWIGNHSIQAFVSFLSYNGRTPLDEGAALWVQEHASLLAISLLLYFLVCFLSLIGIAYWRREKGLNAYLLMGCTIGAMVIPSVSHDYKLALLAAPMAIFFGNVVLPSQFYKKMLSYFLILAASISYSATLYSFMYRPDYIANSMPLLFVILTVVTLLYIMKPSPAKDSDDLHELKSNIIVE